MKLVAVGLPPALSGCGVCTACCATWHRTGWDSGYFWHPPRRGTLPRAIYFDRSVSPRPVAPASEWIDEIRPDPKTLGSRPCGHAGGAARWRRAGRIRWACACAWTRGALRSYGTPPAVSGRCTHPADWTAPREACARLHVDYPCSARRRAAELGARHEHPCCLWPGPKGFRRVAGAPRCATFAYQGDARRCGGLL